MGALDEAVISVEADGDATAVGAAALAAAPAAAPAAAASEHLAKPPEHLSKFGRHPLAILYCSEADHLHASHTLMPALQLKLRQLRALGWAVALVPHYEWMPLPAPPRGDDL